MAFPLLTSTDQDGASTLYDDVSNSMPLYSASLLISSPSRVHIEVLLWTVTPVSEKCPFIGQIFSECHYKYSLGTVPRPLLLQNLGNDFLLADHIM